MNCNALPREQLVPFERPGLARRECGRAAALGVPGAGAVTDAGKLS